MNKLSPFKWFVLQNFPFIEEDFDAITNYQLLCKVVEYLNKTINKTNELGEQVEALNNWFNNLDVQDEINNKLDDMAEHGELTDIIAQYLNLAGVLAYDTVNNMKTATNLTNGSIAKTLGYSNYNDGLGSFYKIRNVENTDVVDEINIIALSNPNLVAEKIPYILENKKYILISDSYGTLTNDNTTTWCEQFISNLNINSSNVIIKAQGGARFDISQSAKTFSQLLNEVSASTEITDIIVCGGYNDLGVPYETIRTSISDFKTIASNKFPNAKISIGFVGNTTNYQNIYNVDFACSNYIKSCKELNIRYLNNVQFTLKYNDLMNADTIHPNDNGQIKLGYNISQSYIYGTVTDYAEYYGLTLTANNNFVISNSGGWYYSRENGVTFIGNRLQTNFNNDTGFDFGDGNSNVELCTINELIGNSFETNTIPVNYLLQNSGEFVSGMGVLTLVNHSLKFRPMLVISNNYKQLNSVTWIQLQPFTHAVDTMLL